MSNLETKKDDKIDKRELRDSTKNKTQQTQSLTSYFKTSKSSKFVKSKKQTAAVAASTSDDIDATQERQVNEPEDDSKEHTDKQGDEAEEQEDDADVQANEAEQDQLEEGETDEQEADEEGGAEADAESEEEANDEEGEEEGNEEGEEQTDEEEDEEGEQAEQDDDIVLVEIVNMAAHSTALLAPDLFRGTKKEEAEEWLDSVRHWLRYKEMTPAQSCAALPVLLRDNALCWYNGLADAVKNDFAQLCEAFVARYRTTGITGWQDSAAVWSLKQGEHQSVDDYINLMEKRAAKTNIADEQKRHAMLQGLRPGIRQQVLQHEIATIDDIRKWATISEASECIDDTNSEVTTTLKAIQLQLHALQQQRERSVSPNRRVRFALSGEDDDAEQHRVAAMQRPDSGRQQSIRPPFKDSRRFPGGPTGYRNYRSPAPPNNRSYAPQSADNGVNYNTYASPPVGYERGPSTQRQQQQQYARQGESSCYFCSGRRHERFNCPAYNATCFKCGRIGHFQSVCKAGRRQY